MFRPAAARRVSHVHRFATVALLALAVVLATAGPAAAHAAFVSSRPEPGTQLTAAPGVVEITFTEPLIHDLSSMEVTDPDGKVWERTAFGDRSMQATIGTNSQGVYRVKWKTVSPLDGHTLRGSYEFGVGVTPSELTGTSSVEPRAPDVALAVARAVEYGALLLSVGMLLLITLAQRDPPVTWVRPRLAAALATALVAGVTVVVGEALLSATRPSVTAIADYLSAEPGVPRLVRLGSEAAALIAVRAGARKVTAVGVIASITALSAAGHAAAARPAWWGITVDAVHLVAAGLWAGAIFAFATFRPPGGWRGEEARPLLHRFSPVAVGAFVVTVAFGTLRGSQELVGFSDLISTSYGQVLLLKIVAVALMVPLSWRSWRRRDVRPRAEATLGVIAIGAAALMAAYPVPPQRAAEDTHAAESGGPSTALPEEGDLTIAGETGDVLVGLTLRPGRPGRNDVFVYLLPTEGEEAADGLVATLSVDGDPRPLEPCGPPCRRGEVVLEGGDEITVSIDGIDDEPATFTLPDLPAADGRDLMERAIGTMEGLDSLRYHEEFGPVEPTIISDVSMVAPDRLRSHIENFDRTTIRIGDDLYRREGGGEWEVDLEGPQVNVPTFIWNYEPRIAAHIVGEEQIGEHDTRIVSFFIEHSVGAIWYRIWVDDEGLVRRATMLAQGHFMDHDYSDFNAPIEIEPPVDVAEQEGTEDAS